MLSCIMSRSNNSSVIPFLSNKLSKICSSILITITKEGINPS
nr:MAG TPA: hypothetical protein [Caudoviricetes sp.]